MVPFVGPGLSLLCLTWGFWGVRSDRLATLTELTKSWTTTTTTTTTRRSHKLVNDNRVRYVTHPSGHVGCVIAAEILKRTASGLVLRMVAQLESA
jgi:hypothetical protein